LTAVLMLVIYCTLMLAGKRRRVLRQVARTELPQQMPRTAAARQAMRNGCCCATTAAPAARASGKCGLSADAGYKMIVAECSCAFAVDVAG
jgi:hypothetical protein